MEIVEVGCAVIIRGGKVLVSQRKVGDSHGGLWEFPGGKRKPDETLENCLAREVREELAVEILPERLLERQDRAYPGGMIRLFFYLCQWISGEPCCLDCQDARWASAPELAGLQFLPNDQNILARLIHENVIGTY
ncbi:MAG TPA: (deoxy)nucleoside triphosphate pyrophosphohydrolase [Candidatus Omnitrophota bacterium]|nr:(deoxy)nucleoside triphosphate pyrophosphohydrolase [Candidatus Omnitrophota bacterium]